MSVVMPRVVSLFIYLFIYNYLPVYGLATFVVHTGTSHKT